MVRDGRISRAHRTTALDYLGGNVSANQSQPWTPARFQVVRDQQIAILEVPADRERLWIDLENLGPKHSGRREHFIFGDPVDGERISKGTKGTKFGFYPTCPGKIVSARAEELFELRPATPA